MDATARLGMWSASGRGTARTHIRWPRILLGLVLGGLAVASSALGGAARDPEQEAALAWLNKTAVPLTIGDNSIAPTGIAAVATMVGDARIVGLGEATHGTHEFQLVKTELVEYLVAHEGFTTFAIEGYWSAGERMNAYVLGGTGSDVKALGDFEQWPWMTQEVLGLVDWIRGWNADPKHPAKVRFMGVDCAELYPNTYDAVLAYLHRVDPAIGDRAVALYSDVKLLAPAGAQGGIDSARQVLDLFATLPVTSRTTDADRAEARQDARVILQYAQYTRDSLTNPSSIEAIDDRDGCMAENASYLEQTSPGGVALWAHDGHVSKSADYWAMPVTPMGQILDRTYGSRYEVVGFSFDHGMFNVAGGISGIDGAHLKGSYNETLAMVDLPAFAIDLRSVPAGDARRWLMGPRDFFSVGSVYNPAWRMVAYAHCALPTDFDVLVHIQRSTPTDQIPWRPWMG